MTGIIPSRFIAISHVFFPPQVLMENISRVGSQAYARCARCHQQASVLRISVRSILLWVNLSIKQRNLSIKYWNLAMHDEEEFGVPL
jgi:hypothetical protein